MFFGHSVYKTEEACKTSKGQCTLLTGLWVGSSIYVSSRNVVISFPTRVDCKIINSILAVIYLINFKT